MYPATKPALQVGRKSLYVRVLGAMACATGAAVAKPPGVGILEREPRLLTRTGASSSVMSSVMQTERSWAHLHTVL